jgi:ubiquinone/menaquinone biosynthesis C-methylase UbiE
MSDFIRSFWESQARAHGLSHCASWGDEFAVALEIETIGRHLREGDEVLDAGCANGYSALRQLERVRLKRLVGVDYAGAMIEAAQRARAALAPEERERVEFRLGDVRALDFADGSFDVVYTTRVLINLPNWEEQAQALRECLRVARPGGKVIVSEAFWEPLVLLNAMRLLVRLPPLVEHDFNRYLKKSKLEQLLRSLGLAWEVEEFSSVYYLGSRLLRELVTDPSAYPGYSNPINRIFYEIERDYSGGGFGIQQAYVIRKP